MKFPGILLSLCFAALLAGCGNSSSSKPQVRNLAVDYRIDRKFNWTQPGNKFSGTLHLKVESAEKAAGFTFNTYGITFELAPGERTTIIVKSDPDGVYFNGEYPDLPIRLSQLFNAHRGSYSELFDYDVRAICEVELSQEAPNGSHTLFISCFDIPTMWFYSTEQALSVENPAADKAYELLAEGRQQFKRTF